MKQHTSNGSHRYISPALLTPGQTFLWFMGGIIAMFLVVSLVFAVKLGAEGRLPSLGKLSKAETVAPPAAHKAPANTPPVSPPVTAAPPAPAEQPVSPTLIRPDGNTTFEPGTENVLPQEVAHLARDTPAPGTPPNRAAQASITASPAPAAVPAPSAAVTATAAPAAAIPPAAATPAIQAPAILPRSAAGYAVTAKAPAEDIRRAINGWASAWQNKDVDTYLKHYAGDFTPAGGLTHSVWLQQRRERLGRPGEITVQLSDLDIKADGGNATARFTQSYSAQGKTLRETKTLALTLRDGQWLIRQERIGQ